MQEIDVDFRPCARTFVALLKACTKLKDLDKGVHIHGQIASFELDGTNVFVGTALVDMYAKCGCLMKAREVFNELSVRNVITWTALISGCIEHGDYEEALCCFEGMQCEGNSPDAATFVCVLKGCGSLGELSKGHELNDEIIKRGLDCDNFVGNTLVDTYIRCSSHADAQAVFDRLLHRDLVSWNALLSGYAEGEPYELAFHGFKRMHTEGISPNEITFVCVLKACGNLGAIEKIREKHAEIVKMGLSESDVFISSALVDVYSKCGALVEARKVLSDSKNRDVVAWNAMIGGYVEHDFNEEALACLQQMQIEHISPDVCTFIYTLKACGCIGKTYTGCTLHSEIAKKGLEKDLVIGRTLVDMYAKFGSFANAQKILDNISVRNTFIWNALILGYMEHGNDKSVLFCVKQMQHEGIFPDYVTLICSLRSCARLGMADQGRKLHVDIAKKGLEKEHVLGSAIVDMYISCGLFIEAQEVFKELPHRNIVSWSGLIAGCAQLGESTNVFSIFDRMLGEGIEPDLITFLSVLNACSHAGLLDEGEGYFFTMSIKYGLIPNIEHFTCMVDLFGRSANIHKAVSIVNTMPYHPGIAMWNTVLWACQKWENVELGRQVFEEAVQLDERDIAAYVSMSNIYAKCW